MIPLTASQVAELEPLKAQATAGCAGDEAANALADAGHAIADALDVRQDSDAVRVAGSGDLDGFDGEGASRRSDGDRRTSSACALAVLPADRCHVGVEADHLALELSDLDRLDAQTLPACSRCRCPADVLHVRDDLEVPSGIRVVRLRRCRDADAHGGQCDRSECHGSKTTCELCFEFHCFFVSISHLFRR